MADVHTPAQRSFNMSRVRGKDTKPELPVRQFLTLYWLGCPIYLQFQEPVRIDK